MVLHGCSRDRGEGGFRFTEPGFHAEPTRADPDHLFCPVMSCLSCLSGGHLPAECWSVQGKQTSQGSKKTLHSRLCHLQSFQDCLLAPWNMMTCCGTCCGMLLMTKYLQSYPETTNVFTVQVTAAWKIIWRHRNTRFHTGVWSVLPT